MWVKKRIQLGFLREEDDDFDGGENVPEPEEGAATSTGPAFLCCVRMRLMTLSPKTRCILLLLAIPSAAA